jgi:hypothetical protein
VNNQQAVEFAKASAAESFDQRATYADPVGCYRTNVIDTLGEQSADQYAVRDALAAFDAEVSRLFA